jgi:CO/xanthine dehydrogenase FAD-binding subunit
MVHGAVGIVYNARICLNAFYVTPNRPIAAENALIGSTFTDVTAEKVGKEAVSGAKPQTCNGYMVHVAKALVTRTILACN